MSEQKGRRGMSRNRRGLIGATAALLLLTLSLFDSPENGLDAPNAKAQGASVAAASGADSQVESCVQRELVRPDVEQADIRSPGKATQTENITVNYPSTPEDCRGVVQRNFQFEVVLNQLLRIHGKLRHIKTVLYRWYEIRFTQEEAGSVNCVPSRARPRSRRTRPLLTRQGQEQGHTRQQGHHQGCGHQQNNRTKTVEKVIQDSWQT